MGGVEPVELKRKKGGQGGGVGAGVGTGKVRASYCCTPP